MEYNLPVDITVDILRRVPTETVLDCKSVCKTWRSLVSHQSFSKIHSHRLNHPSSSAHDGDSGMLNFIAFSKNEELYYLEYNENSTKLRKINFTPSLLNVRFLGSCNGLICLSQGPSLDLKTYKPICICNPITREYVMLPEIKTDCDIDGFGWKSGFGYVTSTNEYKVVVIRLKTLFVQVHIYTLGSSNGWRNLGKFNLESVDCWGDGTFANGTLYWIRFDSKMILTFDLAEEKFWEHLSTPPLHTVSNWWFNRIGVLNGLLFFASHLFVKGALFYDIWLLKKKDKNHDMKEQREEHQSMVWSKEFRVARCELVAATKTDGVLIHTGKYLTIYDPKALTSKRLVDFEQQMDRVFPHKNTLISLKALGEEDMKIMELVAVEDTKSHAQPLNQL